MAISNGDSCLDAVIFPNEDKPSFLRVQSFSYGSGLCSHWSDGQFCFLRDHFDFLCAREKETYTLANYDAPELDWPP